MIVWRKAKGTRNWRECGISKRLANVEELGRGDKELNKILVKSQVLKIYFSQKHYSVNNNRKINNFW